jgi:uncharacterized membrane protein YraQ (UPF0718 family)
MHLIFRKEEAEKARMAAVLPEAEVERPLWQNGLYFASMVAILVFANWGKPDVTTGFWYLLYAWKWVLTGLSALGLGALLILWFGVPFWKVLVTAILTGLAAFFAPHEPMIPFIVAVLGLAFITNTGNEALQSWFSSTWTFSKQILPLLLFGVLAAGLLLGRPGEEGLIPSQWIARLVGGNSLWANLFASVVGAFMYFATLTEVPILQGLMGSGMGKGPALALLLAGPALSLPNMLVIQSVLGTKKTTVFVLLVIVMATISGLLFGLIAS